MMDERGSDLLQSPHISGFGLVSELDWQVPMRDCPHGSLIRRIQEKELRMHRLSFAFSLALVAVVSATTETAAQSLAGTGFAWFASGATDSCQILGGDHGKRLIFTFKTGMRYAFGSSGACPPELPLDGHVRIYRIQKLTPAPGEITLLDQRGTGWSVRKEMPGLYKVRLTTR
jgi:hypothetical protein